MLRDSSYKKPFIGALILHLSLLIFFTVKLAGHFDFATPNYSQVHTINAVAVSSIKIDQQLAAVAAAKERVRQQQLAKIRAEQEQILALKRHKLLLEKQRQEAAKQQAELAKAQRIRQQQLARQKLQQQLQRQLSQEVAAAAKQLATAHAQAVQSEVAKYKALIVQAIAQNWLVPSNLAPDLSCQLLISVAPGGVVLSVKLLHSSGDSQLDRSAQTAVWKASPLPVPTASEVFDHFRELRLNVHPQQGGGWNLG